MCMCICVLLKADDDDDDDDTVSIKRAVVCDNTQEREEENFVTMMRCSKSLFFVF